MRTPTAFRRATAPNAPMQNSAAATMRYQVSGTMLDLPLTRDDNGADHGNDQQDGSDFERNDVRAHEVRAEALNVIPGSQIWREGPLHARQDGCQQDEEHGAEACRQTPLIVEAPRASGP